MPATNNNPASEAADIDVATRGEVTRRSSDLVNRELLQAESAGGSEPLEIVRNLDRQFLGWQSPILNSTVQRLFDQFARGHDWDLRALRIVLPSSLARRRLLELLSTEAQKRGVTFYAPRVLTLGQLPEHLYEAKFPFASQLVQHLAWARALKETPSRELRALIVNAPASSEGPRWLELGRVIAGLHRELASERLDFRDVAKRLQGHTEFDRWNTLAEIQKRYLAILHELQLWDVQTARRYALDHDEPKLYASSQMDRPLILVGCVDMNRTQRGFLAAVARQSQVWIAAPESRSALFDAMGCLIPEAWQHHSVDIPSEHVLVGANPQDQAELTAGCLGSFGDRFHAREITVGIPDAEIVPQLRHRLDLAGIDTRYGAGRSLATSEPVTLLTLIGKYVENQSYSAFASLIRHPAVDNLLRRRCPDLPSNWLADIDDYYQETLPRRIDKFVNHEAKSAKTFELVTKTIERWLLKLPKKPQDLSSFVQPLLSILGDAYDQIYCHLEAADEAPLFEAAQKLGDAILDLREVPEAMDYRFSTAELIHWLIDSLSEQTVPEPPSSSSVEMLGWLELAFDDAPALIITGLHDGVVPQSINADPSLPNQLRRQLGLADNDRRFARDLYALQVIEGSRDELRIVVGKTNQAGDPLTPSRLLMAGSLEKLPGRVLHLVGDDAVDRLPPVEDRWRSMAQESSQLRIPKPVDVIPPKQVTVTAFRDYLDCPYRFYLKHVLKLRDDADDMAELDARSFGNLVHHTLEHLFDCPVAKSDNEQEVKDFLIEKLHEEARKQYGAYPSAAVLIQIEQAEMRLAVFARHQAERAAEGWEIRHLEVGSKFEDNVLLGEESKLRLIGRIDRIDYHPQSGRWAIWDYKSSDKAADPRNAHWSKKHGWTNLQLPLYRHIAPKFGVEGDPIIGYINLPRDLKAVGFYEADFGPEELHEADELAHDIASRIADGDFWPETLAQVKFDDFARICQTRTRFVNVPPISTDAGQFEEPQLHAADGLPVPDETIAAANRLIETPVTSEPDLKPLLIRASAGTGKTFQLSNRLLQLLLAGKPVDSILATTFTRKAAGEILARVMERLASACVDEAKRLEIEEHVSGVDASLPNCLATLKRLTASVHRLRIGTLDSFFAQVAKTFSYEMGLPYGWEALDPMQEPKFQMQAVARMLDHQDHQTLVELVRMLAKGETGRRVADEVRGTVNSGYAIYRVTEPEAWDQLPVPTAPSEAAIESALLTLESEKIGHRSGDGQIQRLHHVARIGDWEKVITHGILSNLDADDPTYYGKPLSDSLVRALEVLAERAASELLTVRKIQTLASHRVLDAFDEHYRTLLQQNRQLSFSDVTYFLAKWLGGNNSKKLSDPSRQLEFRLDCGIDHLLLDEFQDTSTDQWQILEPIARQLGSSPGTSIFCVGDTKQAIYGWRGGVAELFEAVIESVPNIEQKELRQSFRSSPNVMTSVNDLFQNLPKHRNWADCDPVAYKWSMSFPEHHTARQDLDGYVQLQNGPKYDRDLSADENRQIALNFAARQISDLTKQSRASVGVLFRNNANVAAMIALLRELGVSASQDGGNPLTDSAAVELILSLVHLADHPGDGICHYHVETSPLATHLPIDVSDASRVSVWFREQVSRLGLGRTIEKISDWLAPSLSTWDQHRLHQLIQIAFQWQSSTQGRLSEFERIVENQKVALPSEAQVKVMTIHMSKGLEFDAVFLPDLQIELQSERGNSLVLRSPDPCSSPDGVLRYMNKSLQRMLPASWQTAFEDYKSRKVTESLCLLYVAMTRAKRALYMNTFPATRGTDTQEFGAILQSVIGDPEQIKLEQTILYQCGNENWYAALPKERTDAPNKTSTQKNPAKAVRGSDDDSNAMGHMTRITLSQNAEDAPLRGLRSENPLLAELGSEPVAVSDAFSIGSAQGVLFDTLIHAFFETVDWLDGYTLDRSLLRQIGQSQLTPDQLQKISLEAAIDEFEDLLRLSSVQAALSRLRYQRERHGKSPDQVEVITEHLVSEQLDGNLLTGTIDRLVILCSEGKPYAAEVIDFKTDAFDEDLVLIWLEDRVDQHRTQMLAYAKVVANLYQIPVENVSTELLMLSTDDLVSVGASTPHERAFR